MKLNYNENLFIPKEKLVLLMREVAEECDLRIYPQEEENKLKEKISDYLKTPKDYVVVGNGSDELIDRIGRLFLEEGDKAVSVTPTFPVFGYCIKHQDAECNAVPLLKNFELDVAQLLDNFTSETKLLYLCSPNNPTANHLGMQLFFPESEEGAGKGLALFEGKNVRLPSSVKVPHMGWNTLRIVKQNEILDGVDDEAYVYFVHSLYPVPVDKEIVCAQTDYGTTFTSAIAEKTCTARSFTQKNQETSD